AAAAAHRSIPRRRARADPPAHRGSACRLSLQPGSAVGAVRSPSHGGRGADEATDTGTRPGPSAGAARVQAACPGRRAMKPPALVALLVVAGALVAGAGLP